MKKRARVLEINSELVTLELVSEEASCKQCPVHSLCGLIPNKRIIKAEATLPLKIGDLVEIESKAQPSLKIAFFVYIFPLIMFFIGVVFANILNKPQGLQFFTGGIFFVLTYIALYLFDKKLRACDRYLAKVEKVITES